MLKLTDVTKTFHTQSHEIKVLHGITLDINKGDMVSIMGPSGSGKTTLLHIMGCLSLPTEGVYQLDEKDVSLLSDKELAQIRNQRFGFIHQNFALIDDESCLENVSVPLLFSNSPIKDVDRIALKMLERFNMGNLMNKKVRTLSGGEKQRVAIARAMVNEPDIILADEPTGSLDRKATVEIMECFTELNKLGKTIIIITHDEQVAACCKRRYKMVDGRLVIICS